MSGHLLLIDASGFAHRAYHAKSPGYRASDGKPTGAILGFMSLIWRLLGDAQADPPTHGAAVFDAPGKDFRRRLFPAYKANRTRSEELDLQLPVMREVTGVMGLEAIACEPFEADDVIATLCRMARAQGMRTTIVSSDKDMCQLVKDGEVEIVDPMNRTRLGEAEVLKKLGVPPLLVPDYQALVGDAVDNIPGIDGIGHKGAGSIIRRYRSLERAIEDCERARPRYRMNPSSRLAIKRNVKGARLYKKLATLKDDAPIGVTLDELTVRPAVKSHIISVLRALEAEHRYEIMFTRDRKLFRAVPALPEGADPLEWWREELNVSGQRIPDLPQCGFYQRRLVKGGAMLPARIWREPEIDFETGKPTGGDVLNCEVAGEAKDALDQWGWIASNPVKKSAYERLKKEFGDARAGVTDSPIGKPFESVDFHTIKPPMFGRKRAPI